MMKGILDDKLMKVAKEAGEIFEQKMKLASSMLDDLPDSENGKKEALRAILYKTKDKDLNAKGLMEELNRVASQ